MNERQWTGEWIWGSGDMSPRNEWRCFRRTFECPDDFDGEAELHISADSRYVLFVNGKLVGRGPVRSWPAEQFYDSYAIGHFLRAGAVNYIAVMVMHYGVSNFYYLRGRGGLIMDAVWQGGVQIATDRQWTTRPLPGSDPRAPRMCCQQGFTEIIDARSDAGIWMLPGYDDSSWERALPLDQAGGNLPWKKLIPRDIPFLTEEKLYPPVVTSLHRVKPPQFTAAFDLRNQMVPGSADHANPVNYYGYLGTVIEIEEDGEIILGFPRGIRNEEIRIDGRLIKEWYGDQPERYYPLNLTKGRHLLLIDITASDHGGSFHLGMHGKEEAVFHLHSPISDNAATPFFTVGPFGHSVSAHWDGIYALPMDHSDYMELKNCASPEEVLSFKSWIREVPDPYYTETDVFGAHVWRVTAERFAVPQAMQNSILSVPESAWLPVWEGYDCELTIDFGKERSGFIGFEIDAPAGTVVDVYGVEYMNEGYTQHTYGLDNTFRYICRAGKQSYLSPVRRGFRYLFFTVRGNTAPVKLHEVYVHQSNYPVADIGSFHSSDPLLNEIWEISRHTTRLCMEDTFVDCPAYEQVYWVGDSRNEALVNYYVFGADEIVKRCLKLVPGSAERSPLYLDQVPSSWDSVIPNWTFFWIIACAEYTAHTGDTGFARDIWPAVRDTLVHYLALLDHSGLLDIEAWNLLDWAPIDQPNKGIVTHQNLFLVKALQQAVLLAAEAGGTAEAEAAGYIERADQLTAAINRHLWDEQRQAYIDCIHSDGRRSTVFSMQTQVVAYLCGTGDDVRSSILEGYLLSPPPGFVQIGSPFMSFFYYEALLKAELPQLMLEDIRKNYGAMLDYGATTCWEMYPSFSENRANPNQLTRSHCHAWSAAPGYFLGESLLGIKRLDTGWHSVLIAPQPSGLKWAKGRVPLPQSGHIAVSWKLTGNHMLLNVEAPDDLILDIRFPEGVTGEAELIRFVREMN